MRRDTRTIAFSNTLLNALRARSYNLYEADYDCNLKSKFLPDVQNIGNLNN